MKLTTKEINALNHELVLFRRALKREQYKASDRHYDNILRMTRGKDVSWDGYNHSWSDGDALVTENGVVTEHYAA